MNYGLVRTVGVMIMIGAAASLASGAIVNTFVFDLFAGCIDGSYGSDSNVCRYGVNVIVYMVAALFFFLGGLIIVYKPKMELSTLIKLAVFSVMYFWLLVLFWRLFDELGNTVLIGNQGPEGFNQYAYLLSIRLDFVLIGIIMGLAWWIPAAVDKTAIDPKKRRKEPRQTFKK